jgi:hypothetical protein
VEKCNRFLFWSKVEAAYGLETVVTVITVIDSPYDHMDIDHMGVFVVVIVVRVESECRRILPGLSRPLCVEATSEWPNRDRLTASQVVAGT